MSIRTIQVQRVLEDIAKSFYASGQVPLLTDILGLVSEYFSVYPAGLPVPLVEDFLITGHPSDVDSVNQMMARVVHNLDVLYENCFNQIDETLSLTAALGSRIDAINRRRMSLHTLIQDYLLATSNANGYYMAVSDNFADVSKTDLRFTSAFVDVANHEVSLPPLSSLTTPLNVSQVGTPSITVTVNGVPSQNFTTVSPWLGAINNLTNSVWEMQVSASSVSEVVVTLDVPVGDPDIGTTISQVAFNPYGVTPVQVWFNYLFQTSSGTPGALLPFGNAIQTDTNPMVFNDTAVQVTNLQINLRKTLNDYIDSSSGSPQYMYVFGAKDIAILSAVFDNFAEWISAPLSIPGDLQPELFIDAVSFTANVDIPTNTNINYFVAADVKGATEVSDFSWQDIAPLTPTSSASLTAPQVVSMNGARSISKFITNSPGLNDLPLLPLDSTNSDLSKKNPSPLIIPGVDVYKLCDFNDQVAPQSSVLGEGINSTKILIIPLNAAATDSIDFWAPYVSGSKESSVAFGRIDIGNGFLYGGDIGESGISFYAETYLNVIDVPPPFLSPFTKEDSNSQTWSTRVYLNGNNLGSLPVGTNSAVLPWAFQAGLNHIAVLGNIPAADAAHPSAYLGTLSLLTNTNLYDYGDVRLASWNYVTFFDLQYNTLDGDFSYTFYNNQIITRRQPTTNFRIQYSTPTGLDPAAIRLRADLSRSTTDNSVSPKIKSYQVRFGYAQ